jgi:pimeloyl-ACP methyl ester carboxylesterase
MIVEIERGRSLSVSVEGVAGSADGGILLLHGLGTNASLWTPQRAALSQSRRVACVEFPGHGESPDWPQVTIQGLSEAVWRVADILGFDRVVLAGTSMGAVIALSSAAIQPDRVSRVILCGAALASSHRSDDLQARADKVASDGLEQLADAMVARWFPAGCSVSDETRRHFRRVFVRTSPEGYASCAKACTQYDLLAELGDLQERVWLVAGKLDGRVPRQFDSIAKSYPRAKLVLLNGVGHYPSVERPNEVTTLISTEV